MTTQTHTHVQPSRVVENGDAPTSSKPIHSAPPAPPPLPAPAAPRHSIWPWIMVMILVAGLAAFLAYRFFGNGAAQTAPATTSSARRGPAVPVVAKLAKRGDLPIYLDGVGTAQALNMVTIHSRVDGQLMKVGFEEGQLVKKGDLIAEIDPRAFQAQVEQAVAQQNKDQATLDNGKRDLERYQEAKDAVPKQQLDTAASQVEQYAAAVKVDQAAIDTANLNLSYCEITAPISGRMGLRLIDVGNIVHATDPNGLAVITQVQPISVVFALAQNVLPQVQKAMANQPKVTALAFDSTLTKLLATGTLEALDNEIDITSGTFKIKANFPNEDNALFPNQFVNVRLLVDTLKDVVLVPSEAIQRSPTSTFVDVIDEDKTVDQRNVTVGPTEADQTVVEEGVDADEMVATAGLDRLEPGAKVTIQSASTKASRGSTTRSGSQPSTQGGRGSGRRGGGRGSGSTINNVETAPGGEGSIP